MLVSPSTTLEGVGYTKDINGVGDEETSDWKMANVYKKLTFYIDEGHRQDMVFASAVSFFQKQSDAGLSNQLFAFLCN